MRGSGPTILTRYQRDAGPTTSGALPDAEHRNDRATGEHGVLQAGPHLLRQVGAQTFADEIADDQHDGEIARPGEGGATDQATGAVADGPAHVHGDRGERDGGEVFVARQAAREEN